MGCYPPLGKILSKVLGKCNGRERWREVRLDFDYALAYPPTETHHMQAMQPVARAVTFASNNSIYVIPPSPPPPQQPQPQEQSTPEPQQPQAPPPGHEPEQQHDAPESQPPQPQTEQPEPPEQQTQDAPPQAEPKPPRGPKRGKKKQPGRVRFGPEPPPPTQQEGQEQAQQEHAQQGPPGNAEKPPGQGHGPHGASPAPTPGYLLRYTPSPLPRWEATPRRHEYFSGEYRSYYPTPVREGIYRIATDANRLTTIFSEENPNACTIV